MEQRFQAGRVIIISWFIAGLGLVGIGFSPYIWLTILLEFVMMFFLVLSAIITNTLQITMVSQEHRGRVMAIIGSLTTITVPFVNLLAGFIGDYVGITAIFASAGFVMLIVVVLAVLNKPLRQVVIKTETS